MPPLVRAALILMIAALTFYSLGVWSEQWAGRLKPWHVACFWLGLVCDLTGTDLMRREAGAFHVTLHTATGALALLLMGIHATWATRVLRRGDARAISTFHRVSVIVWTIWLVPFVSGLILGRRAAHPPLLGTTTPALEQSRAGAAALTGSVELGATPRPLQHHRQPGGSSRPSVSASHSAPAPLSFSVLPASEISTIMVAKPA